MKSLAATLLETLELRAGSVITEKEILALRKRWRPLSKAVREGRIDPQQEDCDLQEYLPMRVADEQAGKGLRWLRSMMLRKDGITPRRTKWMGAQQISDDSGHIHVVQTLDHFLLVGFTWDYNTTGTLAWPQPIYRAVAHNGAFFDYVARAWTAGEATVGGVNAPMFV